MSSFVAAFSRTLDLASACASRLEVALDLRSPTLARRALRALGKSWFVHLSVDETALLPAVVRRVGALTERRRAALGTASPEFHHWCEAQGDRLGLVAGLIGEHQHVALLLDSLAARLEGGECLVGSREWRRLARYLIRIVQRHALQERTILYPWSGAVLPIAERGRVRREARRTRLGLLAQAGSVRAATVPAHAPASAAASTGAVAPA